MNTDLVSVIVPVYNTEQYLEECVESVLNQDYSNIELILVDDGSPDNSPEICDAYAAKDQRVRVIHQRNSGLSCARNAGLAVAKGQWVLFLDSDDEWETSDFVTQLVAFAQTYGADVVCCNYRRMWDKEKQGNLCCALREETDDLSSIIVSNTYISSAGTKLVSHALLSRIGLTFQANVFSEDVLWSLQLLSQAKHVGFVPAAVYLYRVRKDSITHTLSPKNLHDLFAAFRDCKMASLRCEDATRQELCLIYTAFQYCTLLVNMHLTRPKPNRKEREEIFSWADILRHDRHRIVHLVALCKRILGIRATAWLLYRYVRLQGTVT